MFNANAIKKVAMVALMSLSASIQANPQQAEVLVPTVNPHTGEIEYKRCQTFPDCHVAQLEAEEAQDESKQGE